MDGRDPREFDAVHVPASLNVTMTHAGVGTRAAWVVEPERDVVVLGPADEEAVWLGRLLEAAGFRNLRGYLAGGIGAWQGAGLPVESTPALDVAGLAERLRRDDVVLLDVREKDEWAVGHVEGSMHVPYHALGAGLPVGLARLKPVAVACSAGNRSSLAASLLRRAGIDSIPLVSSE